MVGKVAAKVTCFFFSSVLFATAVWPQLRVSSSQELEVYTPLNPYPRFPAGRPKVPDELLQKFKTVTVEEAWQVLREKGYLYQWEGNWRIVHPEVKLVGRAVTAQFMPHRPDLNDVIDRHAREEGLTVEHNLRVIDVLQKDDVVVVDLFGKIAEGIFVGGNLSAAIDARTGTGMVIDGGLRDVGEVIPISNLVAYSRGFHPAALAGVMLTGINIPVRIGNVTVVPGDIVLGDPGGVIFIPPHLVEDVLKHSEAISLHDEFTKMKMREGKYLPSQIYPIMSDTVRKEYDEWLKKRKGGK